MPAGTSIKAGTPCSRVTVCSHHRPEMAPHHSGSCHVQQTLVVHHRNTKPSRGGQSNEGRHPSNSRTDQSGRTSSSSRSSSISSSSRHSLKRAKITEDSSVVVLLLTVFSVFCYLNSLNGDFVHDDIVAVVLNPDVTGRNSLKELLWDDFWGSPMSEPSSHKSYRPLTVFTFRMNAVLSGTETPWSYHVINVSLHALVVVLLMHFCKEVLAWKREASATAAILFASHPVHTEAVSSIVGRADVLCCVLYLSSLIACARNSTSWQVLSLICAALALLAKEPGVTALLVCLTYQLLRFSEARTMGVRRKRKFHWVSQQDDCSTSFISKLAMIIVTMLLLMYARCGMLHGNLPHFTEQDNPAAFSTSFTTRLLTYMYLPAFNLWLLLCPSNLSYDWQMGSVALVESFLDLRNLATVLYLVTLLAVVAKAVRRSSSSIVQKWERKRLVLSLSLLVFPFLPASNLFVTVGFVVAERVLYIPSLGFCLLVSHGLQRLMQRGPILAWVCRACALLLVIFFVLKTVSRNNAWSSRENLFTSGLQSVPNNAKAHYNYANYKKDIGDKFSAIHHYRTALSLWPNHASSHNNLGTLLQDVEEAEDHFREAIKINPCHAKAHYNLASIYSKRNKPEVAKSFLLRAIRLDPQFSTALSALAFIYSDVERKDEEAERLHKWAIAVDPRNADALNNYGTFLEKTGRIAEAMAQYERAITIQPNHTVAILNAARSLKALKNSRKAEELFKRALEIQEDPQIMDNLGLLYVASGRYENASKIYKTLLQRFPHHTEAKLHYAQLLIQDRSYREAEMLLLTVRQIGEVKYQKEVFHLLASLYSLTNRTSKALDFILKALDGCESKENTCARYYAEHGDILKDLDDYDSAEESYKLALLLNPNLAKTHLNLAVIYHIKGNYTSAMNHYKEAYNLDSSPGVLIENMKKLQRALLPVSTERCWWTESACWLV